MQESASPVVSVIMSVVAVTPHLSDTISSVLGQSEKDIELLIVIDGRSKELQEFLQQINDPRVQLLQNETNLGLTRSLNRALRVARGDFVARIDADDLAYPDRLEKQLAFLRKHHDHAMVGTGTRYIGMDDEFLGDAVLLDSHEAITERIIYQNWFVHSSLLIRRSAIDSVGGYDESYRYAQDYRLTLSLITRGFKVANLTETLTDYRMNPNGLSFGSKMKDQDRCALRARWAAVKTGFFPYTDARYLLRPLISCLIPLWLSQLMIRGVFRKPQGQK